MANQKLSALTQAATLAFSDLVYAVINPSGAIASRKSTLDYVLGLLPVSQGILTLESGIPVSNTDQINKSTIFFTPFKGNIVRIYDGVRWRMHTFAETSITLSSLTNAKLYDIFGFISGSTLALELSAAWTNDTTRAEAIVLQDGIKVKSGALTRLYLGTFRTTSTTATENSAGGTTTQVGGKRFLYNEYNAVERPLLVIDTANTWAYTTDTWRLANGATGPLNCVEYILGSIENQISAHLIANVNLTAGSRPARGAVGFDSTSSPSGIRSEVYSGVNITGCLTGRFQSQALGYHFLSWLEKGSDGTCTFVGDNNGAGPQSGLYATIKC